MLAVFDESVLDNGAKQSASLTVELRSAREGVSPLFSLYGEKRRHMVSEVSMRYFSTTIKSKVFKLLIEKSLRYKLLLV